MTVVCPRGVVSCTTAREADRVTEQERQQRFEEALEFAVTYYADTYAALAER